MAQESDKSTSKAWTQMISPKQEVLYINQERSASMEKEVENMMCCLKTIPIIKNMSVTDDIIKIIATLSTGYLVECKFCDRQEHHCFESTNSRSDNRIDHQKASWTCPQCTLLFSSF